MKIFLTGQTGGIGTAIREYLKDYQLVHFPEEVDWLIFAHGVIGEQNIEQTFGVNTMNCIMLTEKFLPYLKKGVIYISSTAGRRGNTKFPIYSASKAALNSYAETMARKHPELQFYALCPGPTNTAMWRKLELGGDAQEPVEVAKAVQAILDGGFKSGDIITVRDGKVTL